MKSLNYYFENRLKNDPISGICLLEINSYALFNGSIVPFYLLIQRIPYIFIHEISNKFNFGKLPLADSELVLEIIL